MPTRVLRPASSVPVGGIRPAVRAGVDAPLSPFTADQHYAEVLGEFNGVFEARSLARAHNHSDNQPLVFMDSTAAKFPGTSPSGTERLRVPEGVGTLDPETGSLRVVMDSRDIGALGAAQATRQGRVPLSLKIEGELEGWNGQIMAVDREGNVLGTMSARDLDGPGAEGLQRRINRPKETAMEDEMDDLLRHALDESVEYSNSLARWTELDGVEDGATVLPRLLADDLIPDHLIPLANRVQARIEEMQAKLGFKFDFHIYDPKNADESSLLHGRDKRFAGYQQYHPISQEIEIGVRAPGGGEPLGLSGETVLHEYVHAVTNALIIHSRSSHAAKGPLRKQVKELEDLLEFVRNDFRENLAKLREQTYDDGFFQLADELQAIDFGRVRRGSGEQAIEFDEAWLIQFSNALDNTDELLAWAMTNPSMQRYLDRLPYKMGDQDMSLWEALVRKIGELLGFEYSKGSALDAVLRQGDELMSFDLNAFNRVAARDRQDFLAAVQHHTPSTPITRPPPTPMARVNPDLTPANVDQHYGETLGAFTRDFDPRALARAHNNSDREPLVFLAPYDEAGGTIFKGTTVGPQHWDRVRGLDAGSGDRLHVPSARATLDPDSKRLTVVVDEKDGPFLESLVVDRESAGYASGRIPVTLKLEGDMAGWNGEVVVLSSDGAYGARIWGRDLRGPGVDSLLRNIDLDAEAQAFVGPVFRGRVGELRQPVTQEQANAAVNRMFDPGYAVIHGERWGETWAPVQLALRELGIPNDRILALPEWGSYTYNTRGPDDFLLSKLGVTSEQVRGTKAWQAHEKKAARGREYREFMDNYFSVGYSVRNPDGTTRHLGGYFRRMEQNDPVRYAAMIDAVKDTPYTRGNVYGSDVEHPNEPIMWLHSGNQLNWEDLNRYFVQEKGHAREMGMHAGDPDQTWRFVAGLDSADRDPTAPRGWWSTETDQGTQTLRDLDRRIDRITRQVPEQHRQELLRILLSRSDEQVTTRLSPLGRGELPDADVLAREVSSDIEAWFSTLPAKDQLASKELIQMMSDRSAWSSGSNLDERISNIYSHIKRQGFQQTLPFVSVARRPFVAPDMGQNNEAALANEMLRTGMWYGDQAALDTLRQISRQDYQIVPKNQANLTIQRMLNEKGFDHILYTNTNENPGQPSIITWDPNLIKPVYGSRRFDRSYANPSYAVLPWWVDLLGQDEEK